MKTIKDYHDLYLKCDVLLLADVFEEFRNNSLKNYGLYPSHCLSAPGLSWDEMLKLRNIKLELITMVTQCLKFFQQVDSNGYVLKILT